jgi:pantothenate synthetase (EC 6.3.2.1)
MRGVGELADLKAALAPLRAEGLALVPTMGNLHAGHLQLVQGRASWRREWR